MRIVSRQLHIGGQVRADGWEVLNVIAGPCVDHVCNAGDMARFADDTFSRVYASHVLEHFDYKDQLLLTLKEWRRILIPGGELCVSVPDLDVLARLFIDRDSLSFQERFFVMRMIFGGHVDSSDYHLVGLNEEFLVAALTAAGFADMRKVEGFGLFSDTSSQLFRGIPISLNLLCRK